MLLQFDGLISYILMSRTPRGARYGEENTMNFDSRFKARRRELAEAVFQCCFVILRKRGRVGGRAKGNADVWHFEKVNDVDTRPQLDQSGGWLQSKKPNGKVHFLKKDDDWYKGRASVFLFSFILAQYIHALATKQGWVEKHWAGKKDGRENVTLLIVTFVQGCPCTTVFIFLSCKRNVWFCGAWRQHLGIIIKANHDPV